MVIAKNVCWIVRSVLQAESAKGVLGDIILIQMNKDV